MRDQSGAVLLCDYPACAARVEYAAPKPSGWLRTWFGSERVDQCPEHLTVPPEVVRVARALAGSK